MLKIVVVFISVFTLNFIFSQADTTKLISPPTVKSDTIDPQLTKMIQQAEKDLEQKKYIIAYDAFLGAQTYNNERVKDSLSGIKINNKIKEISTILECFQKIESAVGLFESKKYYDVLTFVNGCENYDTINLIKSTKIRIKIIEDSILFEGYIQQIKAETEKKSYKKSLEIIEKAKLIKMTAFLDSIETENKKIIAFITERNLKRFNDYKKIADDLKAYAIKSDTLTLSLNTIKEYYHIKYDTCIGYLKSTYKEVYAKVRSNENFDPVTNEFKITDYWEAKDEEIFKMLEDLKAKTDYQFKFIDKIEQVIKADDDKALRNFKKYVYIKDIIYVFLLP